MPSSYLTNLRSDLTDAIRERDTTGITDAVLERINDLECRIAWVQRAYAVVIVRPWWARAVPSFFVRELVA